MLRLFLCGAIASLTTSSYGVELKAPEIVRLPDFNTSNTIQDLNLNPNFSAPPLQPPAPAVAAPSAVGVVPSGAGGPGPSTNNNPRPFVVGVCLNDSNISDKCLNDSTRSAADHLAWMFAKAYARSEIARELRVYFPNVMSRTEQIRELYRMEDKAIKAAEFIMRSDVARLTPFDWRVQQNARIDNWVNRASSDAASGNNWEHSGNGHTFHEGNAYRQLRQINLNGHWGGT
jgi:hypothetical protein